jgi:hypothetical protein
MSIEPQTIGIDGANCREGPDDDSTDHRLGAHLLNLFSTRELTYLTPASSDYLEIRPAFLGPLEAHTLFFA